MRNGFFITPQVFSNVSQRNVLAGVLPLRTADASFDGVLALTLDISWLDILLHSRPIAQGAVVAVFDPAGTMVASNNAGAAQAVFAQRTKNPKGDELFAATADGQTWSYALVPFAQQCDLRRICDARPAAFRQHLSACRDGSLCFPC